MGATFSRIKNWTAEILTYADLNAEIDNILNNLSPSGVDDYSSTATEMRITTDPGEVGSESLATSLAGEVARLRFAIKEIKGSTAAQWYSTAGTSLSELQSAIGSTLRANRIASGQTSTRSSQMVALIPNNSTTSLVLTAATTPFVYYINSTQYTLTSNVTISGLSAGPALNNTCLVNDSQAADEQYTQFLGEYGTNINIDTAGSEIASRVGQWAAFSVNNGSSTEIFSAYISSTVSLSRARRGYFYNSSSAAIPRIKFSDNDTISLLRLAYIFATTASSMAVTYNVPSWSAAEPSSPTTGDYWFDMTNDTWKTYNSVAWVSAGATLIGMSVQSSAACVAAYTNDQAVAVSDVNTFYLEYQSATVIRTRTRFASINVMGQALAFGPVSLSWDITTDLDTGIVEAANTYYYLYVTEDGAPKISDLQPSDLKSARGGRYHPTETWRCVGCAFNDNSSNFHINSVCTFSPGETPATIGNASGQEMSLFRFSASAAAGALTISITDRIGNYPSDLIPTYVPVTGSADLGVGGSNFNGMVQYVLRRKPSITLPVGATLGHGTAASSYVFTYAVDNNGTISLAVAANPFLEDTQNITAVSGSATAGSTLYGPASLSSKFINYIGRVKYNNGLNGTWASANYVTTKPMNFFDEDYVQTSFANFTPVSASFTFCAHTANSVVLGPGDWELNGQVQFNNIASFIGEASFGIFGANGANSNATPAALSSLAPVTVLSGFEGTSVRPKYHDNGATTTHFYGDTRIEVRLTSAVTAYLVSGFSSGGNSVTISGTFVAKRKNRLR